MIKRNEYIDDDNLSELSSLTHLLDNDDVDNDTNDTHTINPIRSGLFQTANDPGGGGGL